MKCFSPLLKGGKFSFVNIHPYFVAYHWKDYLPENNEAWKTVLCYPRPKSRPVKVKQLSNLVRVPFRTYPAVYKRYHSKWACNKNF